MKTIEVRTLPIVDLIPADYNPRKVTPAAKAKLKRSLQTFGLVEPLIWNERSGCVVGGHLRLSLLKELSYTEVPVSVVDLSETEEKALNVILNNPDAQGRYDTAKLAVLLTEMQALAEFEETGFDAKSLRTLTLEPMPHADDESVLEGVEVTLAMTAARYAELETELDHWVATHDLISHVRQR